MLAPTAHIRARDLGRKNMAGARLIARAATHGQGAQAEEILFRR